jgi:nicotinate-nucleotide adenylyltransferase
MEAADQLILDRVLWMLTPDPPHKLGQKITPVEIRLQLVRAAVEDEFLFEVSLLEMDLPSPQFALNTVQEIHSQMPGVEVYYLMGEDSLIDLPEWHEPVSFIQEVDALGVMRRPGERSQLMELEKVIPGLTEKIRFIDSPLLEISSHQIRDRIRQHKACKYYLREKVYKKIVDLGLYLE